MSPAAQQEWSPFFRSWANYAQRCMRGAPTELVEGLPPLSDYCYLDHFDHFQELYSSGKFTESTSCHLQGLVMVVSVELETAKIAADFIAEQLGGARRIDVYHLINPSLLSHACGKGQGVVGCAVVRDSAGGIRKLLTKYANFISIILFQSSEDDVLALFPAKEAKMAIGLLEGWKKTTCARVIELPGSSLLGPDGEGSGDGRNLTPSAEFSTLLSTLRTQTVLNERPGVFVFFPSIPGTGKSTCVFEIEKLLREAVSNRNVIVQVGDATKEPFWPLAKRIGQRDTSSVFIADKNAPVAVWSTIGKICASNQALAVPVLPDASALRTTRVVGLRRKDGSTRSDAVHVYPFSLQYLAVCIARVMGRPAASHAGKLDRSTGRACMIVIKFFALYRSISAEQFLGTLNLKIAGAGALVSPAPIVVPFFGNGNGSESLPDDLEQVLLEALRCQVRARRRSDIVEPQIAV